MPRDASGNYTLPAGNPVISGTVIESTWANPTMSDLGQAITDSLDRFGRGGMVAPFKFTDGSQAAPGIAWANEVGTGFYRQANADMRAVVTGFPSQRWTLNNSSLFKNGTWYPIYTQQGGVIDGPVSSPNLVANEVGFKGTPQRILTGNSAVALADAGGQIRMNSFQVLTINQDLTTLLPIGTEISVVHWSVANEATVTPGTGVNLFLGGSPSGSTARTLGPMADTILRKIATNGWLISGPGVS